MFLLRRYYFVFNSCHKAKNAMDRSETPVCEKIKTENRFFFIKAECDR